MLSIDEIHFNKAFAFTSAIICTLVVILAQHMRLVAPAIKEAYQRGYVATPRFTEVLTTSVANVVGDTQFGAPLGSFRARLRRQNINCGRFQVKGGRLSAPVLVTIPASVHFRALTKGVIYAFQPSILLAAHVPYALALWAISALVI